jgi:hypothetical protein
MLYHVIVAMNRADLSEAIVSLHRNPEYALQVSRRLATAMSKQVVRCRIRPMDLSSSEVETICFEWGREDALAGEPLRRLDFPKPLATAYRHGYRVGKQMARPSADP